MFLHMLLPYYMTSTQKSKGFCEAIKAVADIYCCVRESMLANVIAFLGVVTSLRLFIGQLLPLSGIDIAPNLFMPPYTFE